MLRIAIPLVAAIAMTACIPQMRLPGSVEIGSSRFDDSQYVRAEPGWIASLESGVSDALLGGPFKVGAVVHSNLGTMLVVRVDAITRISAAVVRVDNDFHELEKLGLIWIDLL